MKNELGIEVCCENCTYHHPTNYKHCDACKDRDLSDFCPSFLSLQARIKELQEQQFTKEEAEKIETFLTHGYQMIINENKEIFSKLEKMKGENNEHKGISKKG